MRIIRGLEEISDEFSVGTAITLGNFDGVHIAHQSLIQKIVEIAQKEKLKSVIVSYFPNPSIVLGKNPHFKNIITQEEKEYRLGKTQADYLVLIPFTVQLAETKAEDFLKKILIETLNAKMILTGFNHCFGKNREGDFAFLQKFSNSLKFSVENFDPVYFGEEKISSTLVRSTILNGDMEKAKSLLGRSFDVRGKVIEGFHRGKEIGFPTANIDIPEEIILPPVGVYASCAIVRKKRYRSMTNIGNNPTFQNKKLTIETNLFDFSENLYGETIQIEFEKRIRDEMKFQSIIDLTEQLSKDKETSLEILRKINF